MTLTQAQSTFDTVTTVKTTVELLTQSANAQDFCRRVTHSEYLAGNCRGVALYLLDQRSYLVQVAAYGAVPDDSQVQISAWEETFLARGVRSRRLTVETNALETQVCLPVEVGGVVTGAVLMSLTKGTKTVEVPTDDSRILSNLVGLFMDSKGVSLRTSAPIATPMADPDEISVQELTTRQVQILHFMADGLTNAEIAKHVLLSESTVRQETIRIFRILKCHTRSEAIVKARATGVIARVELNQAGSQPSA